MADVLKFISKKNYELTVYQTESNNAVLVLKVLINVRIKLNASIENANVKKIVSYTFRSAIPVFLEKINEKFR